MNSGDELSIPECSKCGSKVIRTTNVHKVCIRCGFREEIVQ